MVRNGSTSLLLVVGFESTEVDAKIANANFNMFWNEEARGEVGGDRMRIRIRMRMMMMMSSWKQSKPILWALFNTKQCCRRTLYSYNDTYAREINRLNRKRWLAFELLFLWTSVGIQCTWWLYLHVAQPTKNGGETSEHRERVMIWIYPPNLDRAPSLE